MFNPICFSVCKAEFCYFNSFRTVITCDNAIPCSDKLIFFHSQSKGFIAELKAILRGLSTDFQSVTTRGTA